MNLDKLISQLLTSGLQQKDPVLYQVINTLIKEFKNVYAQLESGTLGGSSSGDATYLTHTNQTTDLPNSKQLLAGDGIEFDDSVFGERTINNPLEDLTILTEDNETAEMPNSRRLVAGDNITFDVSTPGILEINGEDAIYYEWSVLTNGDAVSPELIFAGGEVIMVRTP